MKIKIISLFTFLYSLSMSSVREEFNSLLIKTDNGAARLGDLVSDSVFMERDMHGAIEHYKNGYIPCFCFNSSYRITNKNENIEVTKCSTLFSLNRNGTLETQLLPTCDRVIKDGEMNIVVKYFDQLPWTPDYLLKTLNNTLIENLLDSNGVIRSIHDNLNPVKKVKIMDCIFKGHNEKLERFKRKIFKYKTQNNNYRYIYDAKKIIIILQISRLLKIMDKIDDKYIKSIRIKKIEELHSMLKSLKANSGQDENFFKDFFEKFNLEMPLEIQLQNHQNQVSASSHQPYFPQFGHLVIAMMPMQHASQYGFEQPNPHFFDDNPQTEPEVQKTVETLSIADKFDNIPVIYEGEFILMSELKKEYMLDGENMKKVINLDENVRNDPSCLSEITINAVYKNGVTVYIRFFCEPECAFLSCEISGWSRVNPKKLRNQRLPEKDIPITQ